MTYPSDRYNHTGHDPHLRLSGNSRSYIEPDYIASNTQDQLPAISTMGRGPKGDGIQAVLQQTDGEFKITLVNDTTGEVQQSPNLMPPAIRIEQNAQMNSDGSVSGEVDNFDVVLSQGATELSRHKVYLPPGQEGARIYTTSVIPEFNPGKTYLFNIDDLIIDNNLDADWVAQNFVVESAPRLMDILFFIGIYPAGNNFFAAGVIVAPEIMNNGVTQVGVAAYTVLSIATPVIQESNDGELHWFVGDSDTDVPVYKPMVASAHSLQSSDQATVTVIPTSESVSFDFGIPVGAALNVYSKLHTSDGGSPATLTATDDPTDIRTIASTNVGDAFLVVAPASENPSEYDLYIHGVEATDWTIVLNWGGIEGPQGDQGNEGPTGPAGTVSIGTVTTGAAGTNASIIASGSPEAAILDFVIPRGNKGDPGAKGDTGDPGQDGVSMTIAGTMYRPPGSTVPDPLHPWIDDLPELLDFADAVEGTGYVVDDLEYELQTDLYFKGVDATDWTIVQDWGGRPGKKGDKGDPGAKGDTGDPGISAQGITGIYLATSAANAQTVSSANQSWLVFYPEV